MKIVLLIGSLMCITLGLTSCRVKENEEDINESIVWINEPTMKTEFQKYLGWATTITGIAKNTSGKKISYAQCSFSLYDKDDYNLGSAWTNISDLNIDDKWSVEASYIGWTDKEPVRFVFNGFTKI